MKRSSVEARALPYPLAAGADRKSYELPLTLYCVVIAFLWVLVPWLVNDVHPGDNIEQLSRAEHLAWGFPKHPPMPAFVLWTASRVFAPGPFLTYVIGALQVAALYLLAWRLAYRIFDKRRAIIVVLLISGLTYYTSRLHFFNHNTCLMVAYAISVNVAYEASQRRRGWYLLLGVAWALGMYSKYQMVLGIAANATFLLWAGRKSLANTCASLACSAAVCAMLLSPHILWLFQHDFPSFQYAQQYVGAGLRGFDRVRDVIGFSLDQLMRIAPVALWLFLLTRLMPAKRDPRPESASARPAGDTASMLLSIHAWMPFAIMCGLSILHGTDLEMHWGRAFLWMLPVWWLSTKSSESISTLPTSWLVRAMLSYQAVALLAYR